jgi:hypothetical protein
VSGGLSERSKFSNALPAAPFFFYLILSRLLSHHVLGPGSRRGASDGAIALFIRRPARRHGR